MITIKVLDQQQHQNEDVRTIFGVPIVHGGPGSGNFGHEGRPGQVGGSGTGGGGGGGSDSVDTQKRGKKDVNAAILALYADPLNSTMNTPARNWPRSITQGKDKDYEVRRVPLSLLHPTQEGEDRTNDSSRRLAEVYTEVLSGNVDSIDDVRAEDFNPILLDDKNNILDGNHRYSAHEMIGASDILALVPVGRGSGKIRNLAQFLKKR